MITIFGKYSHLMAFIVIMALTILKLNLRWQCPQH